MSKDLKPCPFCGATWGNGLTIGYGGQPATSWHVHCSPCKVTGPRAEGGSTESISIAIDLWNSRFAVAEVDATDTKRLDWLASQGLRGLRWVARPSITGRGYRLHQSTMIGEAMGDTPRQAIDYAMRIGMNKQP